jgi:hypothetical protein
MHCLERVKVPVLATLGGPTKRPMFLKPFPLFPKPRAAYVLKALTGLDQP